ncbi:uncharacterized protein LOC111800037 [Cucurbita pepo subsp. pepo]|uniref:uncharacterized protein LOC111800037 n=1 Tax=Cucurbita pepo subsp. pepo TaxID=3664 RepID=UPI000C9D31C7|nr:uncharacterized protein LOC111800037 [Cucurbita pepo subsp. pepo]XP_023539380.1 uncharacterized protein LOC111800037 [Cucurbita pepo subsp. pepo]
MAKQANSVFLEEWLKSISGISSGFHSKISSSSAREIIQAWAELRSSLEHRLFDDRHIQSLKTLVNSQSSLYVADPQAKLVISILSSPNLSLPDESYPLFLRILYIWVRKSLRPSLVLVDSSVEILSQIFSSKIGLRKNPLFISEGVLILGANSYVVSASEKSKLCCLELLCRILEEEEWLLIGSVGGTVPEFFAGIGYALSSSVNVHVVRLLDSLLGIWGKIGSPTGNLSTGLMILHLIEWVTSGLISLHSFKKLDLLSQAALESSKESYASFAVVMAAAGILRAFNSYKALLKSSERETISRIRISAVDCLESIAKNLISTMEGSSITGNDHGRSLLLLCISLAVARCGPVASRPPVLICVTYALLTEIFPLQRLYAKLLEFSLGESGVLGHSLVKEHLDSVPFKEAGVIAGVLCSRYASIDEDDKKFVENLVWDYCQDIYSRHRRIGLVLRHREDELLENIEKIAESAFLMVVVFALAVTKEKLNSKYTPETQFDVSVRILDSFSCMEYFRRIRMPEYMDTIRGVVASVQENESACVSFIESMPSYQDQTHGPDSSIGQKLQYTWTEDEVQTARMLFYIRVIPTCIERVPTQVYRKVVAPTMFLYMGHPNAKVARASHSVFIAFISGKDDDEDGNRVMLKEELVFYYIERSLSGYPGITPFEGMASGVAALVRYLPAGSPSIFYCIDSLTVKATSLCSENFMDDADLWKTWQGDLEPSKKILDMLLRLISLVDIQVLPSLMTNLAQLVIKLPSEGQNMVLDQLYSLVSEADDVTRKPLLVSWLQSLSYLCSRSRSADAHSNEKQTARLSNFSWIVDPLNRIRSYARL